MSVQTKHVLEYPKFEVDRPGVIVSSFPRSGTHFLMNAIGDAYGYEPWMDMDYGQLPINWWDQTEILSKLTKLKGAKCANILKSHHSMEFFSEVLGQLLEHYHIFYIVRHPINVMESYHKFCLTFDWMEGPQVETAGEFAESPPRGHLMRYLTRQHPTMLHWWLWHTMSWTSVNHPNMHHVRYEDLRDNYQKVIWSFSDIFGIPPMVTDPPARDRSVRPVDGLESVWTPEQEHWAKEVTAPALDRCNYSESLLC